ncbi:hypothetical protein E9993_22720 [Labilibacter sediminis]|nr:hypothetical protein E9993_22720 [Labilibacter sediminis]
MKGLEDAEQKDQEEEIPKDSTPFEDVPKILPSTDSEQIQLKKALMESAEERQVNITIEPYQSFSHLDSNFNQLDLPIAPRAYAYPNHYLALNAAAGPNRNRLMKLFIAKYSQSPEKLWSLVKIQKLESLRLEETADKEKFVSFLIERFNGQKQRISSADFPFMNPRDIFMLNRLLNSISLDNARPSLKNLMTDAFYMVNEFLKCYIRDLAKFEYESAQLARFSSSVFVPNRNIPEGYQDAAGGTIIDEPNFGVIVEYKLPEGPMVKIMMRFDELHGFPSKFLKLMVREMGNIRTNNRDSYDEIKDKVDWLLKFRSELNEFSHLFPLNEA